MNRNVGGISFSLSPVLPENRWYARGLYPVPVVGLSPFGTPDNCFYVHGACLPAIFELCFGGNIPRDSSAQNRSHIL